MNTKKGVSQVLSIIVAAAVLMVMAMTLMVLITGGIGEFGSDIFGQSCQAAVETQCDTGGEFVNTPSACLTTDGGEPAPTEEANLQGYEFEGDNLERVECP